VEGFDEDLYDTGIAPPPESDLLEELQDILSQMRLTATGRIDLNVTPAIYQVEGMCLARPAGSVVIDYLGNVSPCCYLTRLNTRPYMTRTYQDGIMGNVLDTPLGEIISSLRFHEFREMWKAGQIPNICHGCVLLNRMGQLPSQSPHGEKDDPELDAMFNQAGRSVL
jgi:MoaA/NifB/PqqE/SkfB family radical SAM enzyme